MSSGFSYPQPIFTSPIYNPAFYLTLDASGYLTYEYAQTLYLDKNDYRMTYITGITQGTATQGVALVPGINNDISGIGALSCSSLTVNGSTVSSPPIYVLDITPGQATTNKALVLDGSGAIATITSLTATSITGTLQTGAQGNITSLGTLSGLTIGGNLAFTGASRAVSGLSSISATTLTGSLSTAAQTAITSVGTLTNLTLSTTNTGLFVPNIKFWNSTTSLYDNFNHLYYIGVSEGGCVAQKALIVDINKDIGSIRTLNAVNLNGSTKVSGTLADFGSIRVDGTEIITATRSIQNIGDIACSGTMNAFDGYQVNSVAFVDSNRNITANSIGGTLSTVAQPNITSIGKQTFLRATRGEFEVASGTAGDGAAGYNTYPLSIGNDTDTVGTIAGVSFMIDSSFAGANSYAPSALIAATRISGSYAVSDLKFFTRSGPSASDPIAERMRISQDGRIQLGSSDGDMHVNILRANTGCSLRIGSNESSKDCITMTWTYAGAANDGNNLAFNVYGYSNALVIKATSWVGVGTSSPESTLHSSGGSWCNAEFHSKHNSTNGILTWRNATTSYCSISSNATNPASIRLGTCNASFVPNAYCPVYGGAYSNASDERLKRDIVDIEYGLETVMQMKPRSFTWRQDGKRSIGFIAQELNTVLPEPVSIPDDPDTLNEEGLPCNGWSVDYACMVSVLCKAIQELKKEVDELRSIIAE